MRTVCIVASRLYPIRRNSPRRLTESVHDPLEDVLVQPFLHLGMDLGGGGYRRSDHLCSHCPAS